METDILGGVQLGYRTILVLSGGTCQNDLSRYAYQPDKVVGSIADLDHADLAREAIEPEPESPARPRDNGWPRDRSAPTVSVRG
jgi:NagD protein